MTDPVSQTRSAVALRDALSHLQGEIGDCGVTLDYFPSLPPKLQSKLGVEVGKVRQATLLQQFDRCSKARILSASSRESSTWIDAVTSFPEF